MKSINDMAHDYMCNAILKGFPLDEIDTIAERCFKLAEAMQAEAEKRKDKSRPAVLNDFEVDWSQAPSWANWWAIDDGALKAHWCEESPFVGEDIHEWNIVGDYSINFIEAPSFNYQGNWKDSLRKRP